MPVSSSPSTSTPSSSAAPSLSSPPKNKRYRKDKPWDNPDIDHWAPIKVTPDTPLPPPLEESAFAVLFPRYREKYLREIWPVLTSTLKTYGIACELDLIEGSMTVKTTRKCWDVSMIVKARDVLKLLSRSLPIHQAVRVLEDEVYCDVIKIKNLVRSKERFVKRRQRLIGPNGCTLKAIELVTECYVLVQGNTVSCIGSLKGIKAVRRIVEDCMRNIHPIYPIKLLMLRQQLAQDPQLVNENWDRFLPSFKKKSIQSKKKPTVEEGKEDKEGKVRSVFPPAPTKRKVDIAMETGEYFLTPQQKEEKEEGEKKRRREAKAEERKAEREKAFIPPVESIASAEEGRKGQKRKKGEGQREGAGMGAEGAGVSASGVGDLSALKEKLKRGNDKNLKGSRGNGGDASRFLIGGGKERRTEEEEEEAAAAIADIEPGEAKKTSKKRKSDAV